MVAWPFSSSRYFPAHLHVKSASPGKALRQLVSSTRPVLDVGPIAAITGPFHMSSGALKHLAWTQSFPTVF